MSSKPKSAGNPDVAALLSAAISRHQSGDLKGAETQYRAVLAKVPDHAEALYLASDIDRQLGAADQAIDKLEKSLALRPGYLPALEMHGAVAAQAGKFEQAASSFAAAAAQKPTSPDAHYNHGFALFKLQRYEAAARAFQKAVTLKADFGQAEYLLAAALRLLGRLEAAAFAYERTIALQPNNAHALDEYGGVLVDLGRVAEADTVIRRAIAAAPDLHNPYTNLGRLYQNEFARATEALALHDQSLARAPDYAEAHNNRGAALHTLGRFEESAASCRKAIALKPSLVTAYSNLGNALMRSGAMIEAMQAFDQAIALRPDDADSIYNSAFPYLIQGHFAEGWRRYMWRWKCKEYKTPWRGRDLPQWDGGDLRGGALLLWAEQGLGEEILYSSMIGDLLTRGIPLVLEVEPRLVALMQRAFPDIRVCERSDPPHPACADPSIRAQIPLVDLGGHFRPSAASFPPGPRAYLRADTARRDSFRQRLTHNGERPVIGVSWVSRTREIGPHKTTAISDWRPIWNTAGENARFVDLQYGDTTSDRAVAAAQNLALTHLDDLDLTRDLDGLAALISACDLVITISNTTAHLAGALGIPVWIIVPHGPAGMWFWGGPDYEQRWYPSARIFRQAARGRWDDVIDAIARQLPGAV